MLVWLMALALAGRPVDLPDADVDGQIEPADTAAVSAGLEALLAGRTHEAAELFAGAAVKKPNPDVRFLEAHARYLGGEARAAERVAAAGLAVDADHGPLLALHGQILADLGRGEEALFVLERARAAAEATADGATRYRVELVTGLVRADLGEAASAREAWLVARALAEGQGDAARVEEVEAQLARLDGGQGNDLVGRVSEALARGDVARARALASGPKGEDRRSRTRAAVAVALVQRAEGRLDLASTELLAAATVAAEAGLTREEVSARTELSRVLHLAGRVDEAKAQLDQALVRVAGTSFRVVAVDLRAARGHQALLAGQLDAAREELAEARKVAAGLDDKPMRWRLAELTGGVRAAEGQAAEAEVAYRDAVDGWGGAGWYAEAARVACDGLRAAAAAGRPVEGWRSEALRWFERSGDRLAAVHVDVALGLGLARGARDEEALRAFARAEVAAKAAQSASATRMAAVAGSNAAEVLRRMPSERAKALVEELGLQTLVAEHAAWLDARVAYDQAVRDFQAGKYAAARQAFQVAVAGFEGAKEAELALTARKGLAWATWNEAAAAPPANALPAFDGLIEVARALGDRELEIRAAAAGAIAAGRLHLADAPGRLREGAALATSGRMEDLAARCFAELAGQAMPMGDRADAARRAFALRKDEVGVSAMLDVAIDAVNGGDAGLALELATAIRPWAGDHLAKVDQVIRVAQGG